MLTALVSFGAKGAFPINTPIEKTQPVTEKTYDVKDIVMVDANGKTVALSELKGKIVFINLWATWCKPCVEEMPTIARLKEKFEGNENIVFALLNVEADLKKSAKFMKDRNLDLPIYVLGQQLAPEYFQGAIPTTLIFGKNGELLSRTQGARNFDQPELFEALKKLTEQ